MGARHLRVSDVPKSEQVFLTLLEVAGRTFQLGGETVQVLTLLPPRGDILLSGFWPPFELPRYLHLVDERL